MSTKTTESKTKEAVKIPDKKAFYNEKVTVKLFKDNNKYKDDVFVAVNGIGMLVPRGVEVQIPRKYAIALSNSEKQSGFAVDYQAKLQGEASVNL